MLPIEICSGYTLKFEMLFNFILILMIGEIPLCDLTRVWDFATSIPCVDFTQMKAIYYEDDSNIKDTF